MIQRFTHHVDAWPTKIQIYDALFCQVITLRSRRHKNQISEPVPIIGNSVCQLIETPFTKDLLSACSYIDALAN